MGTSKSRITGSLFGALLCAPIAAQVTQRVSVNWRGEQAHGDCFYPSISADGRYVAFESPANNLVPGDTSPWRDVFVRDRRAGTTERVSVSSAGAPGNGRSEYPSISPDGRYVLFVSLASNLVPGDTNGTKDVFVHDRVSGTTERVSVSSAGVQGNAESVSGSVSADGRYVAFMSLATNLVPGDTNGWGDVFVRDRQTGTTERVSVDSNMVQGNSLSGGGPISDDGRYVAFVSFANNLVPGDTNDFLDVFVHDRRTGTTERVSVDSNGQQALPAFVDEDSFDMSRDGRCVAFWSDAPNLVGGDLNWLPDVFVHDRQTGTTELVSVSSSGAQQDYDDGWEALTCRISGDGRYVAFQTVAANLVRGDTNDYFDVFVHDRVSGTTEMVTIDSGGAQGNDYGVDAVMSAGGRYVAFDSPSTNLVHGDTNGKWDIFVRDRLGGTSFTSLCDPGVGGVIGCPCANAPSGAGRGCDNSSATGGAFLAASGGTFLSSDSLVFKTTGEPSIALSIVMQGNAVIPSGVIYGQGVRCLGGTIIRRLFIEHASGGSITAPDFGIGESTVSARSAAKGDVIQPGQSRSYLVYYRDPIVLGGCPASSTFNATQTGEVTWSP